jgi:hypothetical protein
LPVNGAAGFIFATEAADQQDRGRSRGRTLHQFRFDRPPAGGKADVQALNSSELKRQQGAEE